MDKERVDIKGYEGVYQVNKRGQVRSFWKIGNRDNHLGKKPKILNGRKKKQGGFTYLMHTLYSETKPKRHYKTSRLVAQAFLGLDLDDTKKQIYFLDGDGTNCHVDNIRISDGAAEKKEYYERFLHTNDSKRGWLGNLTKHGR